MTRVSKVAQWHVNLVLFFNSSLHDSLQILQYLVPYSIPLVLFHSFLLKMLPFLHNLQLRLCKTLHLRMNLSQRSIVVLIILSFLLFFYGIYDPKRAEQERKLNEVSIFKFFGIIENRAINRADVGPIMDYATHLSSRINSA